MRWNAQEPLGWQSTRWADNESRSWWMRFRGPAIIKLSGTVEIAMAARWPAVCIWLVYRPVQSQRGGNCS